MIFTSPLPGIPKFLLELHRAISRQRVSAIAKSIVSALTAELEEGGETQCGLKFRFNFKSGEINRDEIHTGFK